MIRRIIRIVIYTTLGGVIAVLAVLFLLYRHTPGWYQPLRLTEQQRQEASTYLQRDIANFNKQADFGPEGKTIVLELTQKQANSYLQVLPLISEKAELPPGVSDPMIVFRKDRLILAARHEKTGEQPISLHLALRVEPDKVAVAIDAIQVGSLSLPERMVQDTLSELGHRMEQSSAPVDADDKTVRGRVVRELARLGEAFFAAINGLPMNREFPSQQTGRVIRLESIELEEGKIRLTFVPLGPPVPNAMPEWMQDK